MTNLEGSTYTLAQNWIVAIRNHSCKDKQIEPCDNPVRELVGYHCFGCGAEFYIKKDDIKRTNRKLFESYLMIPNGRAALTRALREDLYLPDVPPSAPAAVSDEPVTVMIVQGGRVLYNRTHENVEISQTRTVTPMYGRGPRDWGQAVDMHVEPGSERTVITLR